MDGNIERSQGVGDTLTDVVCVFPNRVSEGDPTPIELKRGGAFSLPAVDCIDG